MRARFLPLFLFCQFLTAKEITVDNNLNSGPGSLRQALLEAEPSDVIQFDRNLGLIQIGSSADAKTALPVLNGVTIHGHGTAISGEGAYPIFFAFSGENTLHDLTLISGKGQGGNGGDGSGGGGGALGAGGALFISPGLTVNLHNVVFEENEVMGGEGGKAIPGTYIGGGGGGGCYNSDGGNSSLSIGGSGAGGGGIFNCPGGEGDYSGGGGGGTHLSGGGSGVGYVSFNLPPYGSQLASGGGGGGEYSNVREETPMRAALAEEAGLISPREAV